MSTRIVVLAAGKGKRMSSELPKVLIPLRGKPIIGWLLEAVKNSGVDSRPIIVVGPDNETVIESALGDGYEYVVQKEQLGTGDAVRAAEPVLNGSADAVMVLYGDHPFLTAQTIRALNDAHRQSGAVITMMTAKVPDYSGWRSVFSDFGRIVRDAGGRIMKIVEKKDTTPEEAAITEINPAMYSFDSGWLWKNINNLQNNNAQKEYYLTDLAYLAVAEGRGVNSVEIDAKECVGVNTPEQLKVAEGLLGS